MLYKEKEIFIFNDINEMSDFAVKQWNNICDDAIKRKNSFEVALSGGRTPVNFYQKLSYQKSALLWMKTQIFLVDERFVSFDDEESNYRMIQKTLFSQVDIPPENIHPISTSEETPYISAAQYEEHLISYFNLGTQPDKKAKTAFPTFDVIMLGMGEDGHTASLFPGTPSLSETRHLVVAVSPLDVSKKERITLTLPVLNSARNVIFLIAGNNKSPVIKRLLENENSTLPAAKVRPTRGRVFFLLDKEAGSQVLFLK
jgi:6-phosphogluconolactonase